MSPQEKRVEIKNFVRNSMPEDKQKWPAETVSVILDLPIAFVRETARMFRLLDVIELRQRCTECNHNWAAEGEFNCEPCIIKKYSPVFYRGSISSMEPELRALVNQESEAELACA